MSRLLLKAFSRHTKPGLAELDHLILDLRRHQADSRTQGYYDRLQRGSSWLVKARRTVEDREARFIFLWISLNALCAIRSEVRDTPWWAKEKQQHPVLSKQTHDVKSSYELEWFLWRVCGLDAGERVLKTVIEDHVDDVSKLLATRYLMPNYWTWKCRTEEEINQWKESGLRTVREAIGTLYDPKKMYRALREIIVWRLRILRNQLFHGCATDTHSKRRDTGESELEAGSRLLEDLIWAFLILMTSPSGQKMDWPPSPYPRADSPQHQTFGVSWLTN